MAKKRNKRPDTIPNSEKIRKEINEEIGKCIRMYRSKYPYSQEGVAEAIEVSVSTLKRIEDGQGIQAADLYCLSLVLDVDVTDLFGLR